MKYRKVFTKARFHTKSRNNFRVDHKGRRVVVGARGRDGASTAFVGKVIEQGRTSTVLDYGVCCDISFPHVIGVFGNRGSGKSFDLGVFLEEIHRSNRASAGIGEEHAAIVFDVQDQFWTLMYEPDPKYVGDVDQIGELNRWGLTPGRLDDVSVLVPAASDTDVPGAKSFSLAASQMSDADYLAILDVDRFSPMGQALLNLLEVQKDKTPAALARACKGQGSLVNYHLGTIDALKWRLEALAKTGVIAEHGVDVGRMLKPNSLSVILMRNVSDAMRGLIVGVIGRLVADKMGRSHHSRKVRRRTGAESSGNGETLAGRLWMVLDEAHVLVPSDGTTAATGPLIDYVKRGRDAGLSLIFATQQPSAVNSKLMSQVDMTFTHMLGFEADLTAAMNRMPTRNTVDYDIDDERVSSIGDVIRSLSPGEAVLADSASGRVLLVKIRPRCTAHGGDNPN
ncbi:MAG: hypothetical protein OXU42_03205 [Deltaproteobacteria bacterium]|nr:hypothetical protein [Deltaproteobacteria bacterium]